jgi:hypothetical protein
MTALIADGARASAVPEGVPQDAELREMKVVTKYKWASVAPCGNGNRQVNLPARRGYASPHGNYVSILLASSGRIRWAV